MGEGTFRQKTRSKGDFGSRLSAAFRGCQRPPLFRTCFQKSAANQHAAGKMPGYTFKHALVQDAAYATLLRSRRQQLHAHIAATLEDRFPEIVAAQPALLAHHCTEAGLTEPAVGYWLAAGRQAWARSALAEGVALLRRGLALIPALPDTDRRRETELDLQIALGRALMMSQMRSGPGRAE